MTSGSSYQEYEVVDIQASVSDYSYPCCPNEPWPVAVYRITLSRATTFYIFTVIFLDGIPPALGPHTR